MQHIFMLMEQTLALFMASLFLCAVVRGLTAAIGFCSFEIQVVSTFFQSPADRQNILIQKSQKHCMATAASLCLCTQFVI